MRVAIAACCGLGMQLAGCATTDVRGRESDRIAPLRGVPVLPVNVDDAPVAIDAGSNVVTDAELQALSAQLPSLWQRNIDALAAQHGAVRVGTARILGCRVDAGPGRAYTAYQVHCRVDVTFDAAPEGRFTLLSVYADALRRTRSRAIGEREAAQIAQLERNPLLTLDDTRAALLSALDATALLMMQLPLPASEHVRTPPPLSWADKRALSLAALARAQRSGGDVAHALRELASTGTPSDGAVVTPYLDGDNAAVALGALGSLCAVGSIEAVRDAGANAALKRNAADALSRLKACQRLNDALSRATDAAR